MRNPFQANALAGKFLMRDGEAVATSGNYERFVEIDGLRYAHIMDGRTGQPVTGLETHPLPASETVGDLEANINRLLTHFHWGVVTIDVGEDGLRLRHQALPVSRDEAGRVRWCNAFCAILEGLYSRWLQSQGGSAHVILQRERVFSVSDVQFLYYHP